jgi:hypothetical protein
MVERWNKFGHWCKDRCKGAMCKDIKVGRVDITVSPFMTGMAIPVMEFQVWGYKIDKTFA